MLAHPKPRVTAAHGKPSRLPCAALLAPGLTGCVGFWIAATDGILQMMLPQH